MHGQLQTLASGAFCFDRAAHGRLQTLASVGLSVFHRFYLRRMIHYGLLANVGLAQARPNYPTLFTYYPSPLAQRNITEYYYYICYCCYLVVY